MKKLLLSLGVLFGICTMSAAPVTVDFSTSEGLPTAESETATTATIGGADFTFINCKKGTYEGASYLQVSGKNYQGNAYFTVSISEPCERITLTTGSNASTNVKVQLYAGETAIGEAIQLNEKSAAFSWDIPAANQAAGTVYKVATTNKYNAQFSAITFNGDGQVVTPPTPEIETVSNIAAFIEKCTTADYPSVTIDAPVTAIYQNGNNLYVKDASGYLLVFGAVGQTYNNGDVIPAGITGKAQDYSGVYELSSPVTSSFAAGTAGAAVEPEALGLDEISTEQANYYVIVNDATIEAIEGEDMNFNLTAGGETLVLRNKFKLETIPTGEGYTVKAFVGTFGDAAQLYPIEILSESGKETVATPTFSVAAGAVAEGTQVEIECATEGASIFYTIDGTENWLPYTEAIAINEALTLKAYATKDGMDNSAVATADYTIKVVAPITGTEAMFNFVEPGTLDPATEVSSNSNSPEHPLDGVTFTSNGIEVTATGGASVPRIWACSNHGNEYRLYNGATLTIAGANAEILITSIEFAGDQLTAIQPNAEGSSSSYTWTDAEGLNKVEFPIVTKGSYKRADITTIKVTFKKTSGIADVEIDANAPVEYFNLQGVRIEGELTPGLYIRRQGNAAAKVLVR